MIEGELNQRFSFIINGSEAAKTAREFSENEMRTHLASRPDLVEKIMPTDFNVGCRRPTPGNGHLEALSGSKTTVYNEQLARITEKGFIDPDGVEHEVDVVICATGFDTFYFPSYPILINGVDKCKEWFGRDTVPSYLSLGLAEVPNYFISGGAFCPSAHGSFFPIIDAYVSYFVKVIKKMQTENILSLRPRVKATEHYLRHAKTFLKRTAWTGPCASWFKGGKTTGTPAIYPGSRLHFLRLLENPRYEDYEIEYEDEEDMFGFLGDGFHVCERDGSDITWYLGAPRKKVDEEWVKGKMDGLKGESM